MNKTSVIKMEDLELERKSLDFNPAELAELNNYFGGANDNNTLKVSKINAIFIRMTFDVKC